MHNSAHAPSSARRSPAEEAAFVASNPGRLWLARATGNGAAVRAATEAEAPEPNTHAQERPKAAGPAVLVDGVRAAYPEGAGAVGGRGVRGAGRARGAWA